MLKRLSAAVCIVGLIVCAGCATPPAKDGGAGPDAAATKKVQPPPPPLTPTDPFAIENLLPDTTLAYASVDSIDGAIEAIATTALGKILAEEEMQTFLAKPIAQYRNVMAQIVKKTDLPEDALYSAFHGQIAGALLDLVPRDDAQPEFAVLVAARITDAAAADRLMAWVKTSSKNDSDARAFDRVGWQGIVGATDPGNDAEIVIAKHKEIAVFAVVTKGNLSFDRFLKAVEGTVEKSLADAGEYRNAVKKLGTERLMISYVDVDAVRDVLFGLAQAEVKDLRELMKVKAVVRKLGLEGVKSFSAVLQADAPGITQKAFVSAPEPRTGLFDLLPAEPLTPMSVNLAGTDAMLCVGGSYSFPNTLKLVREISEIFDARQTIDGGLAQVAAMTGIDFERELVNQLDDDVVLVMFPPEAAADNPLVASASGLALVLQVKDAKTVQMLLNKLLGLGDMILKSKGMGAIAEMPFMDARLKYAQIAGAPVSPCVALVADRLVIAGGTGPAKEIVRVVQKPGSTPFAERPEFEELIAHAGGEVGPTFIYSDTKQSVASLMSYATTVANLTAKNFRDMTARSGRRQSGEIDFGMPRDWVDMALLPSPRAITSHVFPQVGTSSQDAEGLLSTTYGPLGPIGLPDMTSTSAVAVVAAIAIPNLVASRVASNETSAVASCVVVLSGQATFHKTDFYRKGRLVYANKRDGEGIYDLFRLPNGTDVRLIDQSLAMAFKGSPKAGYLLADITRDRGGAEYDPMIEFAVCAVPAAYDRGGRNIFIMDVGGTVYQADARRIFPEVNAGQRVPFLKKYPSDAELGSKWIPVGM